MSTPHNSADCGDIAKTVLMTGDPLRAKYIAEKFLQDVTQFNFIRNMFGYTGFYKGYKVSVMGSGMGMPSIGIYSYELYKFYNVENIIRIGSAGAYTSEINLFDLVLVDRAWSESTYALAQNGDTSPIQYPSSLLNGIIEQTAKDLHIIKGCVHCSDIFYREKNVTSYDEFFQKYGCICVEMESFALFSNAKVLGKNAACLLTISDSLVTNQELTAEQRQNSFTDMIQLALNSICNI